MSRRDAMRQAEQGWILWTALLFLAVVGSLVWACTTAALQQLRQVSWLVAEVQMNARAEHGLQQLAGQLASGVAPACHGLIADQSAGLDLEYLLEAMRIDGSDRQGVMEQAYRITVQTKVEPGDTPRRWQAWLAAAPVVACE